MGTGLRRAAVLLALSAVWLTQATPAAALLGWSQSPGSSTAQVGQPKAFTLTVSNDNLLSLLGIDDIGCVRVNVGAAFTIQSVSVISGPGNDWFGTRSGSVATVQSDSGGSRLSVGESVTFSITAVPLTAGSQSWTTRVIRDQGCSGTPISGTATLAIQVAAAPTPTPMPTPTPTPTPTLTATPTPTPAPVLPLPSLPLPSIAIPSVAVPTLPATSSAPTTPRPSASGTTPAPSAGSTSSAAPSASVDAPASSAPNSVPSSPGTPSPSAVSGAGSAVDPPSGTSAPGLHAVAATADLASLGLGDVSLAGVTIWVVPAAILGVPGVLVIVWVILQALGVLAWLPAVRRLRGGEVDPLGAR